MLVPCTKRAIRNCVMEVVNRVARHARVKISAPVSSTGRRPIRSESGPSSHCSAMPPAIYRLTEAGASATSALKSRTTCRIPGWIRSVVR